MSQNKTNKSILSYFQPSAPSVPPSTPKRASQLSSSLPPISSPLAGSSPLSHKATPAAKRAPIEIGASDAENSEDDFSEDSLEDLSALLGRDRPAPVASPSRNLYATPRAKRFASGSFHSSPLAIIPKHKFDLKALAKDARLDDATNASSVKAKTASDSRHAVDKDSSGVSFTDIVNEKSGNDAQKVLRAVQRSEPSQSQAQYCFFDREYRVPPSSPVPKQANASPWQLLTKGSSATREGHLVSGVPQTIIVQRGGLPDSLFQWILDELCIQRSCLIRQEYCNIVASCPSQVENLLSPERLEELFIRLGAADELQVKDSELTISKPSHEPYQDRDWSCLESFLTLLPMIANSLSVASVIYAAQAILRMSMDKLLLYNIDLLVRYERAIEILSNAIPSSSWDSFCFETCSQLHVNIKPQFIRVNALLCLPSHDPRTHDLRRRLALVFLYDDPALGRHNPEDVVSIKDVTERLNGADFAIRPKTDFAELKAMVLLLDMVVDDGSVTGFDTPEEEKQFNEDIDELASKLREIWRKINDSGMKLARTEAKSVVEWVQQRLSNSVRTKRKAKKSIFDLLGQEDDPFLPKQQDYMAKFLQKVPKSPQ